MCQKTPRTFDTRDTTAPIDTENLDFPGFSLIFTVFRVPGCPSGSQWSQRCYSGATVGHSGVTVGPQWDWATRTRTTGTPPGMHHARYPIPRVPRTHPPHHCPAPSSRMDTVAAVHQASFGYNHGVKTRKSVIFRIPWKSVIFRIPWKSVIFGIFMKKVSFLTVKQWGFPGIWLKTVILWLKTVIFTKFCTFLWVP